MSAARREVPWTFVGKKPMICTSDSAAAHAQPSRTVSAGPSPRAVRLDRDNQVIRRDEDVDRDDIEGGRAVNQHELVVERRQRRRFSTCSEGALLFEGVEQLQFGGGGSG
jgi:hypothetical protein